MMYQFQRDYNVYALKSWLSNLSNKSQTIFFLDNKTKISSELSVGLANYHKFILSF